MAQILRRPRQPCLHLVGEQVAGFLLEEVRRPEEVELVQEVRDYEFPLASLFHQSGDFLIVFGTAILFPSFIVRRVWGGFVDNLSNRSVTDGCVCRRRGAIVPGRQRSVRCSKVLLPEVPHDDALMSRRVSSDDYNLNAVQRLY